MPATYVSIFERAAVTTSKDMRRLLNLNRDREDFTQQEIEKAYRKRALRFHPDTQQRFGDNALPTEVCNALMADITRARSHLLNGDELVYGRGLDELQERFRNYEWYDCVIEILRTIETNVETVESMVSWLSYASSSVLAILLFSTFWDGKLGLRYINEYSEELHVLKDMLEGVDASTLVSLLQAFKELLDSTEGVQAEAIIELFENMLPVSVKEHEKYPELLEAIKRSEQQIKTSLNDNFINNMTEILMFWPDFICSLPSWTLLISVLSISTVITGTSFPRVLNAFMVTESVILQQKGIVPFLLTLIPLTLYVALLFPLSFLTQASVNLTLLALTTLLDIVTSVAELCMATTSLVIMGITADMNGVIDTSFQLFEACFDLSIRLTFNVTMRVLDWALFYISDHVLLDDFINQANSAMDQFLQLLNPKPSNEADSDSEYEADVYGDPNAFALVQVPEQLSAQQTKANKSPLGSKATFHQPAELLNEDDAFLNELLDLVQDYDNTAPTFI